VPGSPVPVAAGRVAVEEDPGAIATPTAPFALASTAMATPTLKDTRFLDCADRLQPDPPVSAASATDAWVARGSFIRRAIRSPGPSLNVVAASSSRTIWIHPKMRSQTACASRYAVKTIVAAAARIFDSSSGIAMVAMKMTMAVKRTIRIVDGSNVLFAPDGASVVLRAGRRWVEEKRRHGQKKAQQTGRTFILYVRSDTELVGVLKQWEARGYFKVERVL